MDVLGGQPYPVLDERVQLTKLPSLDIFNDHYPGRFPAYWEIRHLGDVVEIAPVLDGDLQRAPGVQRPRLAGPEAPAAGLRPRPRQPEPRLRPAGHRAAPADASCTLHHPITVDRRLEMEHAPTRRKRISVGRWYSFVKMQARVARQMPRIVVVSENSIKDIHDDMGVDTERMRLVPGGRRPRAVPAPGPRSPACPGA